MKKKLYKWIWKKLYRKVLNIEKIYRNNGIMETVNDCIRLENLLHYLRDDIVK